MSDLHVQAERVRPTHGTSQIGAGQVPARFRDDQRYSLTQRMGELEAALAAIGVLPAGDAP